MYVPGWENYVAEGFVNHNTGVGKGRVVAGIIRYALKSGMTPIFVTEKPNLYADMYRDLTDIGQKDLRPVMTNGDEEVPLDDAGGVTLKTPGSGRHNAALMKMAAESSLGDHNIIFTTYSQMQTLKGQQTARQQFLQAFAPNSVVIFDESHNAGGNDSERKNARQKAADGDTSKTGRAAFARALAGAAKGVFYSSATYAKRPSVMDLYFKTDMAKAVEGDVRKLAPSIQAGGVPLQQAVAAMLTQAGQYIRRERSFDGVEYNSPLVPVDRDAAEQISSAMLGVKEFDDLKKLAIANLKKEAKKEAKAVSEDGSTGKSGVESTNFTSVMHNLIDQMLVALKADAAADRAIESLRRGEKPVITVANTMGSFLEEYARGAGLRGGDTMALSFRDLMQRYLERSRIVQIKDAEGGKKHHRLTDEELGPVAVKHFDRVMDEMEHSSAIGRAAVSPIDWLHYRLKQAGYSSGEITGRTHALLYRSADEAPTYRTRASKETSIAGRRAAITGFNSGKLDALVLNQSGATGISLHASEKYTDQRRRRMILAQAEKNIDTHMQMLGRVHRTGQVIAPAYDQLVADIPAEKRPAAVLAKKMASLNANTTAARTSKFTAKDAVDFLNPYGDEVVAQLMEDMPEVHQKLGAPLASEESQLSREEAARKVTGRIPLLPVEDQEQLYDLIESGYQEALERADALGENALEAKTLPLEARRLARTELFSGTPGDTSPFAAPTYADTMQVKRIGKPYTSKEVLEQLAKKLNAPQARSIGSLADLGKEHQDGLIRKTLSEYEKYRTDEESKMLASEMSEPGRHGRLEALDGQRDRWRKAMGRFHIGGQYQLEIPDSGTLYGVLTDIRRKKSVKMPVASGAWSMQFAVADGARSVTLPLSRLETGGVSLAAQKAVHVSGASRDTTGKPVMDLFDSGQSTSTEPRVIVNGNLLAGYSHVKKGQIIAYTTHEGRLEQGILMPRSFDLKEWAEAQPVELASHQISRFFDEAPQGIVRSADGNFEVKRLGSDFILQTPKSKAQGAKYFLDPGLRQIVGDFSSSGNAMRARVDEATMTRAAEYVEQQLGEPLRTDAFKDEARAAGGKSLGITTPANGPAGPAVAGRTDVSEDKASYEPPEAFNQPARAPQAESRSEAVPRSGRGSVARSAPTVLENPERPLPARVAARILSRTAHVQTGRFRTSLTHIQSWQDAAHLIAPLRKNAQEQVAAIVLDAQNRPLAILHHSVGDVMSSRLHAGVIAGAVLRMPKAASIYLAHNHPSGSLQASNPDLHVTDRVSDMLKGTHVKLNGMLIVAPGRSQATFFEPYRQPQVDDIARAVRAGAAAATEIPRFERRLTAVRPHEGPSNPITGKPNGHVVQKLIERARTPGVLMANAQGEHLGTVPIPEREMREMGMGGPTQERLLTRLEQSNAALAVPYGSQVGSAHVADFLHAGGYTVPYAIDSQNWTHSWIPPKERESGASSSPLEPAPPELANDPHVQEAERAYQGGDDEALGRALGSIQDPQHLGATVRAILEKSRVEKADQPAMDEAVAKLLAGEVNEAAAGAVPDFGIKAGPKNEDPDITAIRRRVMANAKYEGLPLMQRARLLTQRWTGLSALAFRQGVFDSFASIASYERLLNKGELLDASVSPYKHTVATQNMPSVMTAVMHTGIPVYKDGAYQRAGDGRKGLLQIFAPLMNHEDGNLLPQWELYAAARRASRLITEKNADGTSR
ncbi:MAG: strawberry notch C-terminal domain-containing protein, partial [Acetobacteraceae bacterium]